ncbi:exodeoxyribonuclease III [Thermoleptolyngbya sp. C42_A2020_037]|uniref:exodeoxyribonuclease III n=1 Tax=Thermoleptolyngbya sp. C42_A2020_037 TaxID=2747799 RepID=UPI001A079D14|nr:exodeoxyribonuclease III [Thermoleptolyngbya sp. C42_A2020_037]MBF2083040.1 exodeoxyribonuclease III [Thermoleptolyngbya sp. C42_A2020_037]
MKIATWNVNSIRTRLEHVINWLTENPVDVLCAQETKVVDADFPMAAFTDLGYICYVSGQKSYNGVALISKTPLESVSCGFEPVLGGAIAAPFDEQKRVITGVLDQVRIVNLYVPNGSSVGSDKYTYKLNWLAVLREYLAKLLEENPKLLVCGDFNVALEDRDIHDPTGREKEVMATDAERQALRAILDLGLADAFRKFNQEDGQFSWWDYRAAAFRRNLGWRIDHHYLSPPLYAEAKSCIIDKAPRKLEKPSDHTPVIVEL